MTWPHQTSMGNLHHVACVVSKSSPCPKHMDKYCTVVVQMQRKPRAGAIRTITHSHTLCEITTFSKLNTYTV
jgi:hypothetical protein